MQRAGLPTAKIESGRDGFPQRLTRLGPRAFDVLLPLLLAVAGLAIVATRTVSVDFRHDDLLGALLVAGQTLPLATRRIAPIGVACVISVALVTHSAIGYQVVDAGTFSSLIAVYSAASLTDNRRGTFLALLSIAAIAGFFVTNRGDWGAPDIAAVCGTWSVAWLAGTFVRLRGEQIEVSGARAAKLEVERDTRAREAVAEEQARMARELHDIVGHALNVIVIQSVGAQRVFDTRPEVPREALASIESIGREALIEMQRMLGVLRATSWQNDASGPQPGLADLSILANHVSEAGIPVELLIEGMSDDVPASVDLSAYRIVQEALTNCLKHSNASRATVTVRHRFEEIEIEVVDDGRAQVGEPNDGEGRGIVGMRERVSLFGGEISVGPDAPGGGYRVWARLPYEVSPR
jgi:signal transduction histidine kinase